METTAPSPTLPLQNGQFRLEIATAFGPRITGAYCGDSPNLFAALPAEPMPDTPTKYICHGGHRLWHSPEAMPRSYMNDDRAPRIEKAAGGIRIKQDTEPATGIRKTIAVLPAGTNAFLVQHILQNNGLWPVSLAPWGISMMAPGGTAVFPQDRHPEERDPLTPDRTFVLWPYSDFADPRIHIGHDFVLLHHDPTMKAACKIGMSITAGWIAYVNHGVAFIKRIARPAAGEKYSDRGCNAESYFCDEFCELETLGPLALLEPGQALVMQEEWQVIEGLPAISSEEEIRRFLIPRLA